MKHRNMLFLHVILLVTPNAFAAHINRPDPMIALCQNGHWEEIQKKIERSKDASKAISPEALPTCINRSLCDNQLSLFKYLVTLTKNGAHYIKRTCINEAIKRGNIKTLQFALQYGLDLSKTYKEDSLLHMASRSKKRTAQLIAFLLQQHQKHLAESGEVLFKLDQRSIISGATPLGEALKQKSYDAAQMLLDAGASLVEAIYVAPHNGIKERVIVPEDGQTKLVERWLKQHGYEGIARLINDQRYTFFHKNGVIRFLSHGVPTVARNTLDYLWKSYQARTFDEIMKDDESSSEDSSATSSSNSENDAEPVMRKICFGVCDEEKEKAYVSLANCNHQICKSCAHHTIRHKDAHPKEDLVCPAQGCGSPISWDKLAKFGIKPYTILKLQVNEQEKELNENPDFHHCHQPDCWGGNFKTFAYGDEKKRHFACKVCGVTQCYRCGQHHPKVDCQDLRHKQNEQFIKKQLKEKVMKQCPECDWVIEKNQGCNHMTCKKCHYQFYWDTLEKYVPNS